RQGDGAGARPLLDQSIAQYQRLSDLEGIAYSLEAYAELAYVQRKPKRAVQLYAAAGRLRDVEGAPLCPAERGQYDTRIVSLRQLLGEEQFTAVWEEGYDMGLEHAITYAVDAD